MSTSVLPPQAETPTSDPAGKASARGTPEGPMETDPDPPVEAPPANPQEGIFPGAGPMEFDPTAVGTPGDPPSQPGLLRSQPRAPASARPSGKWFCPIPRCARRDGALPTGWGCVQSLVSHLRLARQLVAGPQTAGVPGLPRTVGGGVKVPGSEVLLGDAGGPCGVEPRPSGANTFSTVRAAPQGLDILNLLARQIPTLRRVPIAASCCCARVLTCLLQAVEREQTWEDLARLLLFPSIALAALARGGKARRSSSTQQCRLNCLS